MCDQPWLLVNDFNEMLCNNEKEVGASFDFRTTILFRYFLNKCGVIKEVQRFNFIHGGREEEERILFKKVWIGCLSTFP